jgi:transcriptional regulator with XRE-family HTH domain
MEGFGARLAARARELGLSNAEVARRTGLSERRFGNYVADYREPDLQTLASLTKVLLVTSDALLGLSSETGKDQSDRLLEQIETALRQLPASDLELIWVQLRAVAEWRNGLSGGVTRQSSDIRRRKKL